MFQVTRKLTTMAAGLALASLPILVDAQSTATGTTQQTRPGQTRSQQKARSSDQNSPQHHLDEAKKALNSISPGSLQGEARTQITELKQQFSQLEAAWKRESAGAARSGASRSTETTHAGTAGTTGTATGSETTEQTGTTATSRQRPRSGAESGTSTGMSGDKDWMTHYTAITGILDKLNVQANAGMSSSGTSGTTGTTGSASASANIDASVRTKLAEFRRHLELFHTAAMAQRSGASEEEVEDAALQAANPPSTATSPTSSTTASGTTGATGTSGTTSSTTGVVGTSGTSSTTQTTTSVDVDSAAIARITASIDELLRGSTSTSGTAGTTTGTTTGTTGTSGTMSSTTPATGTVCVDRTKLEQLRRDVQALNRKP